MITTSIDFMKVKRSYGGRADAERGPRHAREEGAITKAVTLYQRGGHAQRLRGDLVLADGEERRPWKVFMRFRITNR